MSTVQDAIKHWSHVEPLLRMPTDEAEYDTLVARLDNVLDAGGHDEGHPLAALAARMGDLIQAYDEERRPIPNGTGISVLRYLMNEHALTQSDLPEVGTQSVVSEILSGRRFLNVRHVAALASRFDLPAGVFIDAEDYPARAVRKSDTSS